MLMDPHGKLRPEPPPTPDDQCACPGSLPITLQDHLTALPLACVKCNREVPPESLELSERLVDEIASWLRLHRALYSLWLDSGEYETWAREQLERPDAPVNERGLAVAAQINRHRRTYLWWFQEQDELAFTPRLDCPRCGGTLLKLFDRDICDSCSIVLAQQ